MYVSMRVHELMHAYMYAYAWSMPACVEAFMCSVLRVHAYVSICTHASIFVCMCVIACLYIYVCALALRIHIYMYVVLACVHV